MTRSIALLLFALCTLVVAADAQPSGGGNAASGREVSVTIDDLPIAASVISGPGTDLEKRQSLTTRLLASLTRYQVPTVGFVNEAQLHVVGERDARVALLQQWVDAGMVLGNHSFSHKDFNNLSVAEFEDEVIRGEVVLRQLMNVKSGDRLYFRFPFNHVGKTREQKEGLDSFLTSRNYIKAPHTVDHSDYVFNWIWLKALRENDTALAAQVRSAYLEHLDTAFNYAEHRSREMFGAEIRQIFLIHANELNADCMGEMLERLRRRGYSFITLDRALQDRAYQTKDEYVGTKGISWLHRWASSLGMQSDLRNEPEPPKFIIDLWLARK